MNSKSFIVEGKKNISLNSLSCEPTKDADKKKCESLLEENTTKLSDLQDKLYADNKWGVLLIFQAMDTAGKDGAIKHVLRGLNPQGTQVRSFKQPSAEELDHDYLWRSHYYMPERGNIGIFNRSYYEEVLVVKIHELIKLHNLPQETLTSDVWEKRYRQINDFEKYLLENGIITIKFFLHITKDEQKKRLLDRIDDKTKNWKFSAGDIEERKFWDDYQVAYSECIEKTSTKESPWFVIPANKKWFARAAISQVVVDILEYINPQYPTISEKQKQILNECKELLTKE